MTTTTTSTTTAAAAAAAAAATAAAGAPVRDRGRVRRGARPAAVRTGSAKPDRETEYFAVYRMCTVCTVQRTASSTERRRMAHRRVHERHTHSLSRSHTDGRPSLPPGPARCRLMNHDRPPARRLSCCGGSPAHRSSLALSRPPSHTTRPRAYAPPVWMEHGSMARQTHFFVLKTTPTDRSSRRSGSTRRLL